MTFRSSVPPTRITHTPPRPYLLLADDSYDGRAIMKLAHADARADVADAAKHGRVRSYRAAFKAALFFAWSTARTHRYCFERDREMAALPAAHVALLNERTAALMIDSTSRMLAEVAAIEARAAAMGFRL